MLDCCRRRTIVVRVVAKLGDGLQQSINRSAVAVPHMLAHACTCLHKLGRLVTGLDVHGDAGKVPPLALCGVSRRA